MAERAESKVDLVALWRKKYSRLKDEGKDSDSTSAGKKIPLKLKNRKKMVNPLAPEVTKVSVDRLLSKLATTGSRSISSDEGSIAREEEPIPTIFIPEDKLKACNTEKTEDIVDGGSVVSFDDVSILSHQSHSTFASKTGISRQLSNRSFHIDIVNANGTSFRCERTIHEMIYEIEEAVKSNKPPPNYVPKMVELDPSLLAWDGNSSKSKRRSKKERRSSTVSKDSSAVSSLGMGSACAPKSFPALIKTNSSENLLVNERGGSSMGAGLLSPMDSALGVSTNVLGCLKSVELVLAQADQRSRHMKLKSVQKEKMCEEQRAKIESLLQDRMTRAERHAQEISHVQRQIEWLRIMTICSVLHRMLPFSAIKRAVQHHSRHSIAVVEHSATNKELIQQASEIIARAFRRWYERQMYIKYRLGFARQLRKHRIAITLGLRIYRKRKAVKRIKALLIACQGYQKLQMKKVVTNFLRSVRFIQRYIRSFLLCKYGRIEALSVLWDKIEYPYIKKKLKEREELRNVAVSNKSFELPVEYISEQSRIELKAQAKKWVAIDGKMEESLQKHRFQGNLKQTTSEEAILKLKAPISARIVHIKEIIENKRREYILRREADRKAYISKISVFSPEDALSLLRGSEEVADKIVNKVGFRVPCLSRQLDPFVLYRKLPHQLIYNKIKKTHDDLETFVIKLDKESSSKFAKRYALLKESHEGTDNAKKPRSKGGKKMKRKIPMDTASDERVDDDADGDL